MNKSNNSNQVFADKIISAIDARIELHEAKESHEFERMHRRLDNMDHRVECIGKDIKQIKHTEHQDIMALYDDMEVLKRKVNTK